MSKKSFSSLSMTSSPLEKKAIGVYVFAVDASMSMLLQAAPFGQWSRAKAAIQLISQQIFILSKADSGQKRYQFVVIGFNSQKAIITPLSPKRIFELYSNPTTLSDFLLIELERLGGKQHTNKGLSQIKKIYDDLVLGGSLFNYTKHRSRLSSSQKKSNASIQDIKILLFTDAEDAAERDLENPFTKIDIDPLVGIFVGADTKQPGWIALRQILSKCETHKKKQLFALNGFSSFCELESMQFLSFEKRPYGTLCPSCLAEERSTLYPQKKNPNLIVLKPKDKHKGFDPNNMANNKISAELFVTAGPRKDDDIELGEDAGGIIVEGNCASFWVADGTSESPVVMNFSSRSMAQELGFHFVDELNRIPKKELSVFVEQDPTLVSNLLKKAFDSFLNTWTATLIGLMESDKARKAIDSAFELKEQTRQVTSRTHHEFIDFSTTFLCGIVSARGIGQAACIGNCPLCIGKANSLQFYRLSNNSIFARLRRVSEGYRFDPASISEDIIVQKFKNANIVVAGSDGIGKLPEFLTEQMKSFSWTDIRKRIHRFIPKSNDDKTFCVINIG